MFLHSAFLFFFIADLASANDRKVLEEGVASFFTTFESNLVLDLRDVVVTSSDLFLICWVFDGNRFSACFASEAYWLDAKDASNFEGLSSLG